MAPARVGVCKSDAAERDGAENFARREVAVCAEEKNQVADLGRRGPSD